MNREEAIFYIKELQKTYASMDKKVAEAVDMVIEALSQPNYETDTEVRLAVTNRKKEKVILWDAYGEVEYYPIEALSAEQKEEELAKNIARDMATIIENEQDMRVILESANKTELLKDGTLKVNVKSGAEVNRVLVWGDDGCGGLYYADDRPSGEWVIVNKGLDIYICDQCGEVEQIQRIPIWDYCPNCGARMGSD